MTRCVECGLVLDMVDGHTTHPSCDPHDPAAAYIREQHTARELALAGMNQAAETTPDDFALACALINRAALSMPILSSNDMRGYDARWENLHAPVRGAAFTTACRRGWIRKTGKVEASSSTATHGHDIKIYESLIYCAEVAS